MATDSESTGGLVEILKYAGSVLAGGVLMLMGVLRFAYNIKRVAEDASGKADVNAGHVESNAGKIAVLENFRATTEAQHAALMAGQDRIERRLEDQSRKVDRLIERLGG